MLSIQFIDLNSLTNDLLTNLEFCCLLDVVCSLNELYGYDEMFD